MSKHVFTIIVAVVIGLSLLFYLFSFQVRSTQVALVLTFGKPGDTLLEPGYHFQWPWPIQEVRRFDNRIHVQEGRFEETYTRDRYNMITSLCVGWKIGPKAADVIEFNRSFGRGEYPIEEAWLKIEPIVRNQIMAILGQHDLRHLVSYQEEQLEYDDIESDTLKAASSQTLGTYGVEIVLLKIRRLELPASVTSVVYQRMRAERLKEASAKSEEGRTRASVIRADAAAKRKEIMALAQAEAEAIKSEGDKEAAKHFEVFAENPELAIFLRELRALPEILKERTTIILDPSESPIDLFVKGPPEPKPEAE